MNLDRAFGQIQALSYMLVRMTATDQGRDLLLTTGEHFEPHATFFFCGRGHNINAQSLDATLKIAT
jgi:hypothetical protein